MYLRSPKRYSSRRRRGMSFRWLWLYLLTPIIVVVGIAVYENQDELRPQIQEALDGVVEQANDNISTRQAPPPTATPDPAGTLEVANAAWSRGAITEATRLYQEIIGSVPNDVTSHYRYTLGLIMQDFDEEAINVSENTVTANPFSADAWTIRAFAFNYGERYEEAIPFALQALELVPESQANADPNVAAIRARALAQLALSYYELDRNELALSTVQDALELNENSAEALYVRGLINWFYLIDRESALDDFVHAYEISPIAHYVASDLLYLREELGSVFNQIGQVNDAQAQYLEAEELVDLVLEQNPDYPGVLQWAGYYYRFVVGDPNQAFDYLNRCIQANPEIASCHYELGRVLDGREQYIEALASFEQAVELAPENPRYYWWAASATFDTSGCTTAFSYLRQGYQLALDFGNAQLISDYESFFQLCGAPVNQPTPEATDEADPDSGDQ